MKRKISEQHFGEFIRQLGGDWKKFEDKRVCQHCHQLLYRVENAPFDGLAVIRGRATPIEIKSGGRSFAFSEVKEHQRNGLAAWILKHKAPAWLALQMGEDRVNATSGTPRHMWLVPWWNWLKIERTIKDLTKLVSIPYASDTNNRKAVFEYQLGAVEYLRPYELIWINGGWRLPQRHVFREIYLPEKEKPLWTDKDIESTPGSPKTTTEGLMLKEQLSLSLE